MRMRNISRRVTSLYYPSWKHSKNTLANHTLHELLDVFTLCVAAELPVAPTSTLAPNQTSKPQRGDHLIFNLYYCQRLSTFLASCLFILSNLFLFILLNLFPHYFMCRSIQMAYLILYQFTSGTVLIIFCNYLLLTLVGNVSVTLTKRLVSVVLLSLCALSIFPVSTAQSRLPCMPGIFSAHEVFLHCTSLVSPHLKFLLHCSYLLGDIWALKTNIHFLETTSEIR